jgi:hypothetical protein
MRVHGRVAHLGWTHFGMGLSGDPDRPIRDRPSDLTPTGTPVKRLLRIVLALMLPLAAPLAEAGGQVPVATDNYFPLAVDHVWTYRIAGTDEKFVVRVGGVEKIREVDCFRLDASVKGQIVATEHLRTTAEGVFRYRMDREDVVPPLCVCRYPVKPGDAWTTDYKLGTRGAKADFKSDFEAITVPAGKYKAAVVKLEMTEADSKLRATHWYAPNAGLVKLQFEQGKQVIVMELEKFEPAKK